VNPSTPNQRGEEGQGEQRGGDDKCPVTSVLPPGNPTPGVKCAEILLALKLDSWDVYLMPCCMFVIITNIPRRMNRNLDGKRWQTV
jgi:hypothetical protein